MKYLILGYVSETGRQLPGPDLEAWMQEIGAWYEKWGSAGKLRDVGSQLTGGAKTIRLDSVIDGPFMESKEVLGGYSVLEADSMDEAVEMAKSWPGIDRGMITMEVWPIPEQ